MTNYIMPTSVDVPPIRVYFEEIPYGRGPAGAKGIGELPLDGTAPGNCKRHRERDRRGRPAHSADAGNADGNAGGRACLSARAKSSRVVRGEWRRRRRSKRIRWRGCWMCCAKN